MHRWRRRHGLLPGAGIGCSNTGVGMSAPVTLKMAVGTWEDAERYIGRDFPTVHGADAVAGGDVRRMLEVLRVDSPLNTDDRVAVSHGYVQAPAPVAMLMSWAMPAYWDAAQGEGDDDRTYMPPLPICDVPAPGTIMFATNVRTQYVNPVYPGDRISSTAQLIEITRKRTAVGDGAFMTTRTTYRNQRGEVVGIEDLTGFRYTPDAEQ